MVYVASEVGVLGDVFDNAANVVVKGRLGPGQVLVASFMQRAFCVSVTMQACPKCCLARQSSPCMC